MLPVCLLFLYFIFYSVLGWACETTYCSIPVKHFVNRGFLNGPLCPIYGFGGLLVIWLLSPFAQNIFVLFAAAVVITSTLEFLTSWVMELLFHMKWWDYSDQKFNLQGRICLLNSLEFGALSVVAVRYLHPLVVFAFGRLPQKLIYWVSAGLLALLICDIVVTVITVLTLNGALSRVHNALEELVQKGAQETEQLRKSLSQRLEAMSEEEQGHLLQELLVRADEKKELWGTRMKLLQRRIMNAFPRMRSTRYQGVVEKLREVQARLKQFRQEKKSKI